MRSRRGAPRWVSLRVSAPLAWVAFAGCGSERARAELDHADIGVVVEPLVGRVFAGDSLFGFPIQLTATEDRLVVTDLLSEFAVHILDAESGTRVERYGARGEGPGEFMRPGRAFQVDTLLWVFDLRLQRLTGVSLARVAHAAGAESEPITIELDGSGRISALAALEDGGWLGVGFLGQGRFARISATGVLIDVVGALPEAGKIPSQALSQVYQSSIAPRSVAGRVAVAGLLTGRIDLCDVRGGCDARLHVPFPFAPTYELGRADFGAFMRSLPDTRTAYVDVHATDGAIYALFSGRTDVGYGERASFGRHVHVFDWTGELRAVWSLDREAIALTLDPSEERLFTVVHEPLPAVMVYSLEGANADDP